MSPNEETKPASESSPSAGTLNDGEEQAVVKKGKKPFVEPTVSVSLNILDATAFFQGSVGVDTTAP